jgi:hypothetical protein
MEQAGRLELVHILNESAALLFVLIRISTIPQTVAAIQNLQAVREDWNKDRS